MCTITVHMCISNVQQVCTAEFSSEIVLYYMPVPDTGYRHETQYQNPGFRTGVRQFCRSQYFVWSQYILFMFYRFLNQNLPKSLDPKKETQEFRSTMLSEMYDSVGKYIVLNMYSNSVRVHYQCIVNIGVLYANVDGGLHFFISMEGGWRSPNDPPPSLVYAFKCCKFVSSSLDNFSFWKKRQHLYCTQQYCTQQR